MIKKLYSFLIAFVLISLSSLSTAVAQTLAGSGTEDEPYLVATYSDLKLVAQDLSSVYALTADIDAAASKTDSPTGWVPIGTSTNPFTGKLFGRGHKISNLYVNVTTDNVGLFGAIATGTIDSIGIVNADITGNGNVGGLVGSNRSATISNSYTTGKVNGVTNVGGIVGFSNAGTITRSYSTSDVYIQTVSGGGLVGSNNYASVISYSFSAGKIHLSTASTSAVGGLAGFLNGTITNSYSKTPILTEATPAAGSSIGGVAGIAFGSTITNVYAIGAVPGSLATTTGTVGTNVNSTATGLFWNTETSGKSTGLGVGKITSELKSSATYSTYDFTNIWKIDGLNDGYPYLSWQSSESLSGIDYAQKSLSFLSVSNKKGGIVVEFDGSEDYSEASLQIYSITGSSVTVTSLSAQYTDIALPKGQYVGRVITRNGKVSTFKAFVY